MKDSHSRGRLLLGLLFGVVGWTLGCWPLIAATVTVTIYPTAFSPSTVTIHVNDSVEWIWNSANHTTSSTTGLWDSGLYNAPHNYTYQFTSPGTFPYECSYHSFTGLVTVLAVTLPPSVTITNPPNGQVLSAPASLTLGVTATDSAGSVTNVQFFQGATSLGNVASAPYSKAVTGLAAGSYTFSAVASDNRGLNATNSITVHVVTPAPLTLTAGQRVSLTGFQFSYAADPGLSYVVQRSGDLGNWIGIQTNTAASNPVVVLDNQASASTGFYRVWRLPNP